MKDKAKILASVILVLAMVVGLCACGGGTGGKDSSKLDLDYEGGNDTQEQQEQQSGFQSWINEAFSFGKKENESSSANDQQGSSGSQTQQGSSGSSGSGQSGQNSYNSNPGSQSGSSGQSQQGGSSGQSQQGGQSSQGSQSGTQSGNSGSSGNKNQSGKNSSGSSQSGQSGSQNGSGTQTQQGTQTSQQSGQSGNQNSSGNSGGNNQNTGNSSKKTVTITIRCDTAVKNGMHLESKWAGIVPASGVILPVTTVEIEDGQTVFDVLAYVCSKYKIHMSYRGGTSSGCYVDGINNLFEFDGGRWSGWMYCVNKWYPNYGCGVYYVKAGDVIEWNYTCDLGLDLEGADIFGAEEWKETHD